MVEFCTLETMHRRRQSGLCPKMDQLKWLLCSEQVQRELFVGIQHNKFNLSCLVARSHRSYVRCSVSLPRTRLHDLSASQQIQHELVGRHDPQTTACLSY